MMDLQVTQVQVVGSAQHKAMSAPGAKLPYEVDSETLKPTRSRRLRVSAREFSEKPVRGISNHELS